MPQGEDTFHAANYQAAGELAKAGVTSRSRAAATRTSRLVPFQAAMSVAWGLSHDDAIKALTINAAKIFGADKALGTIEAGKIANLIVVTGDPLEIRSRIKHVVIGGRNVRSRASTRSSSSATWGDSSSRRSSSRGTRTHEVLDSFIAAHAVFAAAVSLGRSRSGDRLGVAGGPHATP